MRKAAAILLAIAMLGAAIAMGVAVVNFIDLFNGGVHLLVILNSNN